MGLENQVHCVPFVDSCLVGIVRLKGVEAIFMCGQTK